MDWCAKVVRAQKVKLTEQACVDKCKLRNLREQVTLPEEPFAMLSGKKQKKFLLWMLFASRRGRKTST